MQDEAVLHLHYLGLLVNQTGVFSTKLIKIKKEIVALVRLKLNFNILIFACMYMHTVHKA